MPAVLDDVARHEALPIVGRHDGGADQRQPDLPAMRVPGQREHDAVGDLGEQIRIVRDQEHGSARVGDGAKGAGQVVRAAPEIADPCDPERTRRRPDPYGRVFQHPDPGRLERPLDSRSVERPVVIAHDGDDAPRGAELTQLRRDRLRGHERPAGDAQRDHVAEDADQIRMGRIGAGDDFRQASEPIVRRADVQVAQHRHPERPGSGPPDGQIDLLHMEARGLEPESPHERPEHGERRDPHEHAPGTHAGVGVAAVTLMEPNNSVKPSGNTSEGRDPA
jgi:hypothetical protein